VVIQSLVTSTFARRPAGREFQRHERWYYKELWRFEKVEGEEGEQLSWGALGLDALDFLPNRSRHYTAPNLSAVLHGVAVYDV
jgi:hypothetical protein